MLECFSLSSANLILNQYAKIGQLVNMVYTMLKYVDGGIQC